MNSFSNIAFILGALCAWRVSRSVGHGDDWQPILFALALSIGVSSFIFHSIPNPETLWLDLVPIQVFGLVLSAYVALKYLRLRAVFTVVLLPAFFLARQFWIALTPKGALGGGITHIPALLLLITFAFLLHRKDVRLWRYLAAATATYVAALVARSFDLVVCAAFPWGLHWVWHLLTALTASLVLYGVASEPPDTPTGADASP